MCKAILKTILCPFVLGWQAFRIYILGCVGIYFERFFRKLCCCCCGPFQDKQFPANAKSLGAIGGKSEAQLEKEVDWCRVGDICARGGQHGAKLFAGEIEPADICQGSVGNCWLMSALACLADVEGAIQRAFLTREYNDHGKYKIRLFDAKKDDFVTITIDDRIPCKKGTTEPMFAKPNGDEAWVLLLEKAFAKFMGSYQNTDGGHTMWAFEAMTGNYVFKFKQDEKVKQGTKWTRFEMVASKDKMGSIMVQPTQDVCNYDEMFATVMFYTRKHSVIAASSGGGGNDTQNVNGIVQGHAYSLTNAKEVDKFRLVQLRNPWGSFEWSGDWGDNSPLWQQYPKVARAVDFEAADDGSFWMEWKDFCQYYRNLEFCLRETGWDDIHLDLNEHRPCCGPCIGCMGGCLRYWFCCLGVKAHCCANKKQTYEKAKTGCCSCTGCAG